MPEQTEVARRQGWAESLIRKAAGRFPRYGSAAWLALPEGCPEKVAAVVVAAECWAVDADDPAPRLLCELDERWHADKRAEDADYRARVEEHRARWRHLASVTPRYLKQPPPRPLEEIGAEYMARRRGAEAR